MSLREFILALGGPKAAAHLFGVTPPAVYNWLAAGALPARVHYRAHLEAQARALRFDPTQGAQA